MASRVLLGTLFFKKNYLLFFLHFPLASIISVHALGIVSKCGITLAIINVSLAQVRIISHYLLSCVFSLLQDTKLNEEKSTPEPSNVLVNTTTETTNAEVEDELSLSLTLPNPSPQSSGSEISEAISSCPRFGNNYKDCSSSSTHTLK